MVALSEVTTLCTVDPQILFFWRIVLSIAALLLSHVHCNIILSTCIRQFLWDLTEIALSTDRPQDKWHDSCTKPIHKHYFSLRLLWPLSCSHGFSAETLYRAHLRAALMTFLCLSSIWKSLFCLHSRRVCELHIELWAGSYFLWGDGKLLPCPLALTAPDEQYKLAEASLPNIFDMFSLCCFQDYLSSVFNNLWYFLHLDFFVFILDGVCRIFEPASF